jgi:hypothetical protein
VVPVGPIIGVNEVIDGWAILTVTTTLNSVGKINFNIF